MAASWRRTFATLVSLFLFAGVLVSASRADEPAHLARDISAEDPATGGVLELDSVSTFDPAGGDAVIRAGTSFEERFSYGGVDTSANTLLDITRTEPLAHAAGSEVTPLKLSAEPSPTPSASGTESPPQDDPATTSSESPPTDDGTQPSAAGTEDPSGPDSADTNCPICEQIITRIEQACALLSDCDVSALQDLIDSIQITDLEALVEEVNDRLEEQCTFGPASSSAAVDPDHACVDLVLQLVTNALMDVCGSSNPQTCADNLVNELTALLDEVNDTVANFCRGYIATSPTTDSALTNCSNRVMSEVNSWLIDVCQATAASPTTCLTNLLEKINDLVAGACQPIPGMTTTSGVINHPCEELLLDIVAFVLNSACGSPDAVTCADNLIDELMGLLDQLNDTVANFCRGYIATSPTTDSALTNCSNRVMSEVNSWLMDVCQATAASPATCLTNLLEKINDLVAEACQPIPGVTGATSSSVIDHPCEELLLDIVAFALNAACGSPEAATCISNLLDAIDDVVVGLCAPDPRFSPTSVGDHPCGDAVVHLIETQLEGMCGSTDAVGCAANVISAIKDGLASLCGSMSPSASLVFLPSLGFSECVESATYAVTSLIDSACGTPDPSSCVAQAFDELQAEVTRQCSNIEIVETTGCVTRALGSSSIEFDSYYAAVMPPASVDVWFTVIGGTGLPVEAATPWIASITGANPGPPMSGVTDASGRGHITYTARATGFDTITVASGVATASAQRRVGVDDPDATDDSAGQSTTCVSSCGPEELSFEDQEYLLMINTVDGHCPQPSANGHVTNCIDEGPFHDDNQDGVPDRSHGHTWFSDAGVDFYGCSDVHHKCHNYSYPRGCESNCKLNPGYYQRITNPLGPAEGVQRNQIYKRAVKRCPPPGKPAHNACTMDNRSGDVGITTTFEADGNEWYRAVVDAKLTKVSGGGFFAKLVVVPLDTNGRQLTGQECIAKLRVTDVEKHPGLLFHLPKDSSALPDVASLRIEYRGHIDDANFASDSSSQPDSSSGVASLFHMTVRQVLARDGVTPSENGNCLVDSGYE